MHCLDLPGTIRKYHKLHSLNNRHLLPHSSGVYRSMISMSAWSLSDNGSLSGLQIAALLLCPHMVERERASSPMSLFIRAPIPSWGIKKKKKKKISTGELKTTKIIRWKTKRLEESKQKAENKEYESNVERLGWWMNRSNIGLTGGPDKWHRLWPHLMTSSNPNCLPKALIS